MMRMVAIVLLGIFGTPSFAQRFPLRFQSLNPLGIESQNVSPDETSWMHSTGGWGEFSAYRLVRDNEHAWLQRLGGYVEILRVGDEMSLAFLSDIEFIADPHNDIRFNPRAIFWEEGFLFTQRLAETYWQAGYFHRCKHDIDNYVLATERSLIFGSLHGAYMLPWRAENQLAEGLFAFRADVYTIRQDDRFPVSTRQLEPNLKRMLGTLGASAYFRKNLSSKYWGIYSTLWSMVNFYGEKEGIINRLDGIRSALFNGGMTLGIALQGNVHMRLGISYEFLSDTGINPTPGKAHLMTIGVTFIDPTVMW